ncbi:MAG: hypothetical protein EZS28_033139, partial [Streblomastix strix]
MQSENTMTDEQYGQQAIYHCCLAVHRATESNVMMKEIRILDDAIEKMMMQKIELMQRLRSEYTVELLCSQVIGDRCRLMVEYCDQGNMLEFVLKSTNDDIAITEKKLWEIIGSLALALNHLHKKGKDPFVPDKVKMAKPFIAPELVRGQTRCTVRTDLYSLGVNLYFIAEQRSPFLNESLQYTGGILSLILKGSITPFIILKNEQQKKLIMELMSMDPDKRPTTDQILNIPEVQYALYDDTTPIHPLLALNPTGYPSSQFQLQPYPYQQQQQSSSSSSLHTPQSQQQIIQQIPSQSQLIKLELANCIRAGFVDMISDVENEEIEEKLEECSKGA